VLGERSQAGSGSGHGQWLAPVQQIIQILSARTCATPLINQLQSASGDRRVELDAPRSACRLAPGIGAYPALPGGRADFHGLETAVSSATSGLDSAQQIRAGECRQFRKAATPQRADERAIEPNIPALTHAFAAPNERMIPPRYHPARRRLNFPSCKLRIALRPLPSPLFHKEYRALFLILTCGNQSAPFDCTCQESKAIFRVRDGKRSAFWQSVKEFLTRQKSNLSDASH